MLTVVQRNQQVEVKNENKKYLHFVKRLTLNFYGTRGQPLEA